MLIYGVSKGGIIHRENEQPVADRKTTHPHGTIWRYKDGCRCDMCKEVSEGWITQTFGKPKPEHGTPARYWRGCRCDDCKRAVREYRERREKIRREEEARKAAEPSEIEHGTAFAYLKGCRCEECVKARGL